MYNDNPYLDEDTERARPLNTELAWKVRDLIVAHPEHHDQSTWFEDRSLSGWDNPERDAPRAADDVLHRCGTVACAAGWALLLAGWTINDNQAAFRPDGSEADWIGREAELVLGLTVEEAERLFSETDNADVPRVIEEIFGPRPEAGC